MDADLHCRHDPDRQRDWPSRRHFASAPLSRDRLAADRVYRDVSLYAAARADHLVLLRISGRDRDQYPGACRGDDGVVALWWCVLRGDRAWLDRECAARTVGCGARARATAVAAVAPRDHPA